MEAIIARSLVARLARNVHRSQQAENGSCGAHGPAKVVHQVTGLAADAVRSLPADVVRRTLRVVDFGSYLEVSSWR